MKKRTIAAICCVMAFGATPAIGQDGNKCTVRDQKGAVAFVVCPPGLAPADWRKAGQAACSGHKPCSAWIWDNPDKAPKTAPPLANMVEQADVLTTVAIWDNDTQQLMMISKVK